MLLRVKPETRKYRNLRRDPLAAISVLDPARSDRSIELRGEVIAFTRYEDLTFVNQLGPARGIPCTHPRPRPIPAGH